MSIDTEFELIEYTVTDSVATLRLDRPHKKNAINDTMREEIKTALDTFATQSDATVLVITGTGDSFSAGTDIEELEERLPESLTQAISLEAFELPEHIADLEKPVIAMVNGDAIGGGLELALACDFRFASTSARIGFPEITLGAFPGEGGTQRLPRETNLGTALFLLLTGELIEAPRARELQIVQTTYEPDELEGQTMETAKTIAQHDPTALAMTKRMAMMAGGTELQQGLEFEGLLANILEARPERKRQLEKFFD